MKLLIFLLFVFLFTFCKVKPLPKKATELLVTKTAYIPNDKLYRDSLVYTYDFNNNKTTELTYLWSLEKSVFLKYKLYTYTYDSKNNLASCLEQLWNWDTTNAFRNLDKITHIYTYDNKNNIKTDIPQQWNHYNDFLNNWKHTYTYDSKGNRLTKLWEYLDDSSKVYMTEEKTTYVYDKKNNLTTELLQTWDYDTKKLVDKYKTTCSYDQNNNIVTKTIESLLSRNNSYDEKYFYTYDPKNNLISLSNQYYHPKRKRYVDSNIYTYTYDEKGDKATELYKLYNDYSDIETSKAAENHHFVTYTYNENNIIIEELRQMWDKETNEFGKKSVRKYYYKSSSEK